jgi:aspartyl-tRNA(Asn)/glutamyl-tRNA(Gln) amidotransferase subunit C
MSDKQDQSPAIDQAQVQHVARLSRLHVSDAELSHFTGQLAQVLDYVHKLSELDVEHVEPLTTAIDMTNVLREDAEQAGLDVEQTLNNAPDRSEAYFKVPKVLE